MRGLTTEGNLRFKIDWVSRVVESRFTVFLCFTLYSRAIFQVQAPGGLYLEGQFNGGFFALPVWGAYTWRGLFSEFYSISFEFTVTTNLFAFTLLKDFPLTVINTRIRCTSSGPLWSYGIRIS